MGPNREPLKAPVELASKLSDPAGGLFCDAVMPDRLAPDRVPCSPTEFHPETVVLPVGVTVMFSTPLTEPVEKFTLIAGEPVRVPPVMAVLPDGTRTSPLTPPVVVRCRHIARCRWHAGCRRLITGEENAGGDLRSAHAAGRYRPGAIQAVIQCASAKGELAAVSQGERVLTAGREIGGRHPKTRNAQLHDGLLLAVNGQGAGQGHRGALGKMSGVTCVDDDRSPVCSNGNTVPLAGGLLVKFGVVPDAAGKPWAATGVFAAAMETVGVVVVVVVVVPDDPPDGVEDAVVEAPPPDEQPASTIRPAHAANR